MDMRDGNIQLGKLLLLLRMIGSVCLTHELLIGLLLVVGLGIVMILTLSFVVICSGIGVAQRGRRSGGGGVTWHFSVYLVDEFCCLCTTIPVTFYTLYPTIH